MSMWNELEEEHKKDGLFTETDVGVSYPLGFPILDEQLGFIQNIVLPNGEIHTQYRLGAPAGTITVFAGPSSSGKTAAAIQAGWNMVEQYGEDAQLGIFDAESATEPQRVIDLLGISQYEYKERVRLFNRPEQNTFESSLKAISAICEKKESDKARFQYNTGFKNIEGEDIIYYLPTAIVIDSLMKMMPKDDLDDIDEMQGLTANGRTTIKRNFWLSKLVTLGRKYNLNFIIVNHLGNDFGMSAPGQAPKGKALTYMPTGKNMPGGDKFVFYMSSCVLFVPINAKDTIKTEEENGYNGSPVRVSICKSRTGPGGKSATMEFIQEAGYDPRLTLLNFARSEGLISGRNPKCYFTSHPDVTFDTRIFLDEMREKPEIVRTLFEECKPRLHALLRTPADQDDFIRGSNAKKDARDLMRSLYQ